MKRIFTLTLVLTLLVSLSGCFYLDRITAGEEAVYTDVLSDSNPYAPYFDQYYNYILPDSDSRYLSWQDVAVLSYREVYLAQQEIYARCGHTFEEWDLQEYFSAREWYVPASPERELSDYASMNAFFLEVYAAVLDGSVYNQGNPYLALCSSDFLLSYSSTRELTAGDLQGLTSKELALARNEIFARHGYIFSDLELRTYFYTKSWYRPTTLSSDFNFGSLSALEVANVELIQAYEDGKYGPIPDDNTGNNSSGNNTSGSNGNQNNSGNAGSVPSHVTMADKYTYLVGDSCYHIPYVDLPTATAINQKMYNDCYELLQNYVFAYPDSIMLWSMTYSVGRQGDVVSVLVYCNQDWGCDVILVYNFSASTGNQLSSTQVFGAYGLSENDGRNKIWAALEDYWERQLTTYPEGFADAQSCKEETLTDSNVAKWTPYIDASGNLCFTGPIYSPAGAGCYDHLLDQSGTNQTSPTCYIH